MSIFDPEKYKIKPPIKAEFEGSVIYIRSSLDGLQSLAFGQEVSELKEEGDQLGHLFPALVVKARVVTEDGEPVFTGTAEELVKTYDSEMFRGLYQLVKEKTGESSTVSEAEKKS